MAQVLGVMIKSFTCERTKVGYESCDAKAHVNVRQVSFKTSALSLALCMYAQARQDVVGELRMAKHMPPHPQHVGSPTAILRPRPT